MEVLLLDLEGNPEKGIKWDEEGILIVGSASQSDLRIQDDQIGPIQCYLQSEGITEYALVHVDPDSETMYQGKAIERVSIGKGEMFQIPGYLVSIQEDSGDGSGSTTGSPSKSKSHKKESRSRSKTHAKKEPATASMTAEQQTKTEDRVLRRFLLREGVVSEQDMKECMKLQESLKKEDVYLPLGQLLCLKNYLSERVYQEIDEHLTEHMGGYDETLPAYLKHSFVNDPNFPDTALKEGLISTDEHKKARKIQRKLEEKEVYLPLGEVLVKWGFIKLSKAKALQLSRESEDRTGGTMTEEGKTTESEEDTIPELSELSFTDRTMMESLIRENKLDRSQVPGILEAARNRSETGSISSSLRNVLTEEGIVDSDELTRMTSSEFSKVRLPQEREPMGFGLKVAVFLLCFVGGGAGIFILGGQTQGGDNRDYQQETARDEGDFIPAGLRNESQSSSSEKQASASDQNSGGQNSKNDTLSIPDQNGVFLAKGQNRFTFSVRLSPKQLRLPSDQLFLKVFLEDHPVYPTYIQLNKRAGGRYEITMDPPFYDPNSNRKEDLVPFGLYRLKLFYSSSRPPLTAPDPVYLAAEEYYSPLDSSFEAFLNGQSWKTEIVKPYGSRQRIKKSRTELLEFLRKQLQDFQNPEGAFSEWKTKLARVYSTGKSPSSETFLKLTRKIEEIAQEKQKNIKNIETRFQILPFGEIRKNVRQYVRGLPQNMFALTRRAFQEYYEGSLPHWLENKNRSSDLPLPELAEKPKKISQEIARKMKKPLSDSAFSLLDNVIQNLYNTSRLLSMLEDKQSFLASFPYLSDEKYATVIQFLDFVEGYLTFQELGIRFSSLSSVLDQSEARKKKEILRKLPEVLKQKAHFLIYRGLQEEDVRIPDNLISSKKQIKNRSINELNDAINRAFNKVKPSVN